MTEIGMIFHFGVYSYPAFDDVDSARRRKIQNGSDWYYMRLIDKGNFRPTSGHEATKKFHDEHYHGMSYDNFSNLLDSENFDKKVQLWIEQAYSIGASYMILTTKHHDGYCLWNTSTGKKTLFDYLSVFVEKVRSSGLKLGFYYSWMEFGVSPTIEYFNRVVIPQINELKNIILTYGGSMETGQ